ncbi:hypothetical protein [Bradyrhizobium sp. BR 10289]|uniref:hypothetical protein n=1 Tax=Bradyrhizobium sp. BR 10289 TaxID=2749993 RepID=UPI001C64609B|nr:hypothetical protein [Bradyrhizobium sp. BR 10289]MBW7971576.1 hypothetical protein [Bradyrhizobium sp. BR 10289]
MTTQASLQFVTKTATSATQFVDSIGVNTHLGFALSPYSNVTLVKASLDYLGISNIRDGLYYNAAATQSFSVLAAAGYKFDFAITLQSNSTVDVAKFVSTLDSYEARYAGSIAAIEGANEVNYWPVNVNGNTSIASGAIVQQQIYNAVNADPLLKNVSVYNVTIGSTDTSLFNQLGNLSGATDYANGHAYVMSTTNISAGLDYLLGFAKISAPGKPVVITETGYTTLTSTWYNGVSETVQAKYTLDTLMDAYQKGVAETYLYELLDEDSWLSPSDPQSHYGLFHSDGTPKLAATAIHNLSKILADGGANASAATGSLTYALSGTPSTSHDMLLAKSNGSVDLVLWAEPVLWNQTTHSAVQATSSPVTITFGQTEGLIKVYDPLISSNPVATYTNVSSIQVSISDHPLVIEVTPVVKAISAGLASTASTTSSSYVGGALATQTTTFAAGSNDLTDVKTYTNGVVTRETITHADNSKDVYIYNVQNQGYTTEHDTFNAAGALTTTIRTHADGTFAYFYNVSSDGAKTTDQYNAAGLIVSETILNADGSSDVKTYTNGVISSETVKNVTTSSTSSVISSYTNGALATQTFKYAAGGFEIMTYSNGVVTKNDIVHLDNSEDVYTHNVQGKDYVAGHDTYNSSRVLTASVHTHADGSLAYSYNLATDGTKTTDLYDATGHLTSDTVLRTNGYTETKTYANGVITGDTIKYAVGAADISDTKVYTAGVLTSDTIVHADKSKDVYLSNVQGKTYVAEHDVYNTAGVLTSTVRTHLDGSLDYSYTLKSDGTKVTDQYSASSSLTSDSVVRTDGSSEVKTFANGSLTSDVVKYAAGAADISDSKTYTAGALTNETIVHASKAKDVYDWNVTGKSYVADHFQYDATGRLTTTDLTNVDGSHAQTASVTGVSLTSTTAVADTLAAASVGGDSFVFKPNSGNDTIVGFHAGNAANHDTIMIDNSVVSIFNHLVMQQVGKDTLITLDAHDSILVKNVAPTALTSADFQFFAHHDLVV